MLSLSILLGDPSACIDSSLELTVGKFNTGSALILVLSNFYLL